MEKVISCEYFVGRAFLLRPVTRVQYVCRELRVCLVPSEICDEPGWGHHPDKVLRTVSIDLSSGYGDIKQGSDMGELPNPGIEMD